MFNFKHTTFCPANLLTQEKRKEKSLSLHWMNSSHTCAVHFWSTDPDAGCLERWGSSGQDKQTASARVAHYSSIGRYHTGKAGGVNVWLSGFRSQCRLFSPELVHTCLPDFPNTDCWSFHHTTHSFTRLTNDRPLLLTTQGCDRPVLQTGLISPPQWLAG